MCEYPYRKEHINKKEALLCIFVTALFMSILLIVACAFMGDKKIVHEERVNITVTVNAAFYDETWGYKTSDSTEHGEAFVQYQDYEYHIVSSVAGKALQGNIEKEVSAVMWRVTYSDNTVVWKIVEVAGIEIPAENSFGRRFIIEQDSILEAQYDTEID